MVSVEQNRLFPGIEELQSSVRTLDFWLVILWKVLCLALVYLILYSFFDHLALPPDGDLFHMFAIFIFAHIVGKIVKLFGLPSLFGMLVAGFIYGNATHYTVNKQMATTTRSIALMIILIRAGLHLDPHKIRNLSFMVARVAFVPCLAEAVGVAVSAYYFFDFNISWALMLGFVMSAVSPAVVVPGMMKIVSSGKYDVSKGITDLIIAAASIDDILAIAGFSISLGFAFAKLDHDNTVDLVVSAVKAPMEAVIGVVFGLLAGVLCWYLPEVCVKQDQTTRPYTDKYNLYRFLLLLLFGLVSQFGSTKFNINGAGPMASLVVAFVASLRWRENGLEKSSERSFQVLWVVFQHFLFALIASDVRIALMESDVLLFGVVTLAVGLLLRLISAYLVVFGKGFNHNERLFTALSWTPKATVQAAFGPVALDYATSDKEKADGHVILTVAVLSILITAPVGAILIEVFSKILLTKKAPGHSPPPCPSIEMATESMKQRDEHRVDINSNHSAH